MRWRPFRWSVAGVLLCALVSPAEATIPESPTEARVRTLMAEARRATAQGRDDLAVERLREAWEVYKDPMIVCNLGRIEAGMGRARDAAQDLSMCLRLLKADDKKVLGRKLQHELNKMLARVGALNIDVNVPDAEVLVDGKAMGKLPAEDPIFVEPGHHGVEVRAPGYAPDAKLAVLRPGSKMYMLMRLEPLRVEVAPAPHSQETAPAETEAKAKPKAEEKPKGAGLAGKESLLLKEAAPLDTSAEPARAPARMGVIFAGFGLGVVGAVVGGASLASIGSAKEEMIKKASATLENPEGCKPNSDAGCPGVSGEFDKGVALTAVGVAGIAVATAGGALIVYEFLRAAPQGGKASTHISAVPTPSGGALQISGTF
jgi:hypothetical protein